jgi:hypothetical protein
MKKNLLLLLVLGAVMACKSKNNSTSKDSVVSNIYNKKQSNNELMREFEPIIQGVWVKADYINKLIKTKSPLAASDLATGLTTIYIDTNQIKGDSIVTMAGYYNHDGANATIKFQPGKKSSTILFNGKDLSYAIEKGDTVLILSQYEDKKRQFVDTKYIRVLKKQPNDNLGYGMDYYINKALFAGNYLLTDSTGKSTKVNFSADGNLTGFLDFKTYSINVDLNSDVNDNLDEIDLAGSAKQHLFSITFKIDADTLNLYDTKENADSTELITSKLIYKLVRQK